MHALLVSDDHRSCQKLTNYNTNIKAISKRYYSIQKLSGLIQTDATNDVVVNSFFGVTNNRVYNDVFRTFTFSMQQSEPFVSTRITIYITYKKNNYQYV
jgi:hypothetical protein